MPFQNKGANHDTIISDDMLGYVYHGYSSIYTRDEGIKANIIQEERKCS